ncbi:MAG: sulfite exporter TauE/SafE family protein, partial [Actinomycetaceae bacterium]|nr:sulfite exporter TauE/SafE family protein [Actinomycetaceae bacterium]
FITRGQVNWPAAIAVGVGAFAGGYVAPIIQRYIPENVMRWMVAVGGLVMTVWLIVR